MTDGRHHVAVAGAGIVGSAIALHLARQGARVTLIDALPPGSAASAASFGWINASFAETDAYFRLRAAALDEWQGVPRLTGGAIGARWGGSLWWEEEGDALARQAALLAARGHDARVIDRATFARLEPRVAGAPEAAIHATREGSADAAEAARQFARAAAGAGATLLAGATVTGLLTAGGQVRGLRTSHGEIPADRVVLALGAATEALAAAAGLRVPMANVPGIILHTTPVAPVVDHIILSPDIHFRQEPDGRLVAGEVFSGDGPGKDRITTDPAGLAEDVLARLRARLPGVADLRLDRVMLGLRPVPVDGLPVVGAMRGADGLYVAAMHSGVTLGPLVGRLAAGEILGGEGAALLAPFRPDRFN
jgi:glycine/D-amino acid oxidase-like deaminating enzyme